MSHPYPRVNTCLSFAITQMVLHCVAGSFVQFTVLGSPTLCIIALLLCLQPFSTVGLVFAIVSACLERTGRTEAARRNGERAGSMASYSCICTVLMFGAILIGCGSQFCR